MSLAWEIRSSLEFSSTLPPTDPPPARPPITALVPNSNVAPATQVSHDDTAAEHEPNPPVPTADIAHDDQTDPADEDVRALVRLANTNRSRRASASWHRIERSLAHYRNVIQGVTP